MLVATEATGISQGDILIRSAVIAAISDLRANPYLLKYVFASLPADALTAAVYGADQVDRAAYWFQHTDIKVFLNVNMNSVSFPCISIGLAASVEDDATLGDIHYEPFEDTATDWPVLAGPTSPASYDFGTGTMTFADDALGGLVLAPGMIVVDRAGNQYPITEAPDTSTTVVIAAGVVANFEGMVIRSQNPSGITAIESIVYKETYSLGCHADSEPVHLTYLHSILIFALLRYKQSLLEARGFERSSLSSSDLRRDDETLPEVLYSRYVQLTGFVRQAWPKDTRSKIGSVSAKLFVAPAAIPPATPSTEDPIPFPVEEVEVTASVAAAATAAAASTVYYGVAPTGTINEAFVLALPTSHRTFTRTAQIDYVAGAANYCWYVLPVDLAGDMSGNDFIDEQTAEVAGFSLVATILVAGVFCQVWRTNQMNLGPLTVIVT